jgi:hypothetical protein
MATLMIRVRDVYMVTYVDAESLLYGHPYKEACRRIHCHSYERAGRCLYGHSYEEASIESVLGFLEMSL